ncbi:hypothetical protein JTE90_009585 [Oedothorax gibbosus]|uniref:SAM-dependent MTase RsmB/NOP-type domain-containing protein n=1 Tax=Oedothorax gibbosus TaxID=931172 RepID=A0AAV6VKE9_9ARAC|nr:hypothetical protein JTE90_009585 [Oedothorax gibbosus]
MAEISQYNINVQDKINNKKTFVQEFERVPPCYKEAEKVLSQVKACKGNVNTVMGKTRLRGSLFKKVHSLVSKVLIYWPLLEKILEDTELLVKESYFRKEFAGILVYEQIFGKGLPGESRPVQAIRRNEKEIKEAYNNAKKDFDFSSIRRTHPRYARVNTIVTSVSAVLDDLRKNDYQQVTYDRNTSLDGYMNLVKSLQTGYFLIDYHFKDLLVFPSEENLTRWHLYQNGHIFIQDKSSYIPVHALNPKPGDTVLDACAAPGMKTIHIAAAMKNEGKIYAYDRDKSRFDTLKETLNAAQVTIAEAEHEDFYLVNADDPKFRSVECILLDPSCSGSGMVSRMDSVTDTEDSKNTLRLQKLAGFQILLLKHALLFRSVKRVVYSTCSVTEEENEYVVHEVLNTFGNMFKLVSVMPDWPIRGSDNFEHGHLCLRANSNESLTNGFFVAMFERLEGATGESFPLYLPRQNTNRKFKKDKRKTFGANEEIPNVKQNEKECVPIKEENDIEGEPARKKHKKSKKSAKDVDNVTEKVMELKVENFDSNVSEVKENSVIIKMETDLEENAVKKKGKNSQIAPEENINAASETTDETECNSAKKKRKRNRKKSESQDTLSDENALRLKMEEDIENEKKLNIKQEDEEIPSEVHSKKSRKKKCKDKKKQEE